MAASLIILQPTGKRKATSYTPEACGSPTPQIAVSNRDASVQLEGKLIWHCIDVSQTIAPKFFACDYSILRSRRPASSNTRLDFPLRLLDERSPYRNSPPSFSRRFDASANTRTLRMFQRHRQLGGLAALTRHAGA